MSMRKRFNEVFGLEDGIEEERKRFVQRVNQSIFHNIDTDDREHFDYYKLFELICFELGINAHDVPERILRHTQELPAKIRTLTRDDFTQTLLVLCILYRCVVYLSDEKECRKWLSKRIEAALSRSSCDIGVRWKDGFFYPAGAEELDKPLIEETLTWLKKYPNEMKDYQTALQYYLGGKTLGDVVKNCYSAIEGIARNILGNKKTLDNNKDELLSKINLSDSWKSLLANYIKYAHDYRHASSERHGIKKQEAEAYLYMTGLIIRLVIESK
ncbi:MAG: hypothetical protein WCZ89_06935 [Phycisphaerae bacterium]